MLERLPALRRRLNFAAFVFCALLIGAAYYLEYVQNMDPCPLCMLQRVILAGLGLVFLAAALQAPRSWGRHVYALVIALVAATGAAVAARHVWLQSLPPDQVPACGPGLDYLMQVYPFFETLLVVLKGSGECAEVDLVLGVSIPVWTLLVFIGLGIAGVIVNALGGRRD